MMVIANIVLDLRADMLMRLLSYNEVICHKQIVLRPINHHDDDVARLHKEWLKVLHQRQC
jgi:hypothetical protein